MKKLLCLLFALIFVTASFASCATTKKEQLPDKQVLENVYLTSEFELPEGFNPQKLAFGDNEIYFYGFSSDEIEDEDGAITYKSYMHIYKTDYECTSVDSILSEEIVYDDSKPNEMRGEEIESILLSEDGRLFAFYNSWYENWAEEEMIYENDWRLCELDKTTGEIIGEPINFEGIFEENEYGYIASVDVLKDGRFLLTTYDELITTDAQGNILTRHSAENISEIKVLDDDRTIVTYYDENWNFGWGEYNLETGEITNYATLPQTNATVSITDSGKVYTSDPTQLVEYDLLTGEELGVKISWMNSDINATRIWNVYEAGDKFMAIEDAGDKTLLLTLTPCDEVIEKYVITLGSLYLDSSMNEEIIKFNRANEEHRISVKLYDNFDEEGNYTGEKDFDNDILQGNIPDIIVFDPSTIDYTKYASKGLLADIGALIDQSSTLSREDLLENVLKAGEYKGKLVTLIPEFAISTVIGKKSVVGDRTAWSWADYEKVAAENPEAKPFGEMEREELFRGILGATLWDYVNLDTGECNFETDGFKSLLNFVNLFPETIDWDEYYEDYDWDAQQDDMENDKILLATNYIGYPEDFYWITNDNQFGEEISFIGFPTASGAPGTALEVYSSISVSHASPFKEKAFEFIQVLIGENAYDDSYAFPINRAAFDKKFEESLKLYKEYQESEPAITSELQEAYISFVESLDRISAPYEHEIINIVLEESAAFFNGEKSVDETCRIIQSRAFIYASENM